MWTYIKNNDISNYLEQYPHLESFWNQLTLLKTNDAIFIPRLMIKNYPSPLLHIHAGTNQVSPEKVDFNFTKKLRPHQIPIANFLLDKYKTENMLNGIAKLRTGFGKTVLFAYISSKIGLKTCITVDSDPLMKQWIESYLEFTNLTQKDIGIIKGDILVTNKPVCIATTQTLLSKLKTNIHKAFKLIDDAKFGLVGLDEVHATSASENFSKVSLLFRTPNIFGLSATPFQTGAAEVLMKNTVGKIIIENNEYDMIPKYYFVYYNSGLGEKYSRAMYRINDVIKKKALYNSITINSPKYLSLISKYAGNLVKNGHKVIIIVMTKNQVNKISEELTNNFIEHRRYYGDEKEIDKLNDKILVATYSFAGKGFDMESLSALIFACPLSGKKSTIQVIGRILRTKEGKKEPIVIDLIDMDFPLMYLPEVKRKTNILNTEFKNIEINTHKEL